MKTVCVVQARLGSSRLPGKVLFDLGGQPVLRWAVNAGRNALGVDQTVVATTTSKLDNEIVSWCSKNRIACVRGSEEDVLERFIIVQEKTGADVLLRTTSDCPFLDNRVISDVIRLRRLYDCTYASNVDPPTFPDGLDTECFTAIALFAANWGAHRPSDRECVTTFIQRNKIMFTQANLTCAMPGLHTERWVLDTEDDYKFCQEIVKRLRGGVTYYQHILDILDREPALRNINKHHPRNERFYESIVKEEPVPRNFDTSKFMLRQAEEIIPLGAQTFSKSKVQYPEQAPLFNSHGDGGRMFDADGNDYVDLVMGLLSVILGHRDPDVNHAIRAQLDRGISFSLSTELEYQLAQRLKRLIPCSEMARFGKNGTDVTTAAVRLARAYTGRNMVLSSGYHGWNDWSVASDPVRNRGVPADISKHIMNVPFDNILEALTGSIWDFACVILEPDDYYNLDEIREECTKRGTLLIFDEIITGFRWHIGGAQSLYGITPDLACFGKAMGNGMPISALVGKREIMQRIAPPDNIFFSGTFMGETLSLAAAIATIDKLEKTNALESIREKSAALYGVVTAIIGGNDIASINISPSGPLHRLSFKGKDNSYNAEAATLFRQEMIKNGVLIIASHNLCYAHTDNDMIRVINAYEKTLEVIKEAEKVGFEKFIVGSSVGEGVRTG